MRECRNTIRLYPWELDSMSEYNSSLPSGTTPGKMWKRRCGTLRNPGSDFGFWDFSLVPGTEYWLVGQYYEIDDPDLIGIRWYHVEFRQGPPTASWCAPDWSNYARWKRDRDAERVART